MRYITVTLNPVIDRTYFLTSAYKAVGLNRAEKMSEVIYSGKGINVSRELLSLGVDSKALCILQGKDGEAARRSMAEEGLDLVPVMCGGRMRNNIAIVDPVGTASEVNEPGCEVTFDTVEKFLSIFEDAVSGDGEKTVVISGSTPPGFTKDIYKDLILRAKKQGCRVVFDADGELLREGLEARPLLIKPNEFELSSLVGIEFSSDSEKAREEALAASSLIYEKTGVEVLCTLGEKGSVFAGAEGNCICPAHAAEIKRFKGAGDMFLARFIYERFELDRPVSESMKIASEQTARKLAE